ncbi:hypothetical protein BH18ACI4_BH18ACI4_12290 [soil metagenome]
MLFTDKFVYVHEPKTGGTFVTSMLFRLYGLNWTRLTHLRNMIFKEVRSLHPKYGELVHNTKKHAGCREIPVHQRGKKVLATVRNPYDLYVSQYEFGWWKRREFLPYLRAVPHFKKDYPTFPNINFAEYVKLTGAAFGKFGAGSDAQSWGLRTREFINFYFRDPSIAWERLKQDADYIAAQKFRSDMFDLNFVRTDELNLGLYNFLVTMGYEDDDVSFVINQEKILPRGRGRTPEQKWQKYYTPELKQQVREKERLLFTLFPEFDV